jgi:mono/diheme cytochrome c family protein
VALACGRCHGDREAPGGLSPWAHESSAMRAVESLLWADAAPAGTSGMAEIDAAWAPDGEVAVARVLATCAGCHVSGRDPTRTPRSP